MKTPRSPFHALPQDARFKIERTRNVINHSIKTLEAMRRATRGQMAVVDLQRLQEDEGLNLDDGLLSQLQEAAWGSAWMADLLSEHLQEKLGDCLSELPDFCSERDQEQQDMTGGAV